MPNPPRNELRALANIEELINSGGEITIGRLHSIECAATACDESNSLAMLQRRHDESLDQLLARLDVAIARAWDEDYFTDEINATD